MTINLQNTQLPDMAEIERIITAALAEDIGYGDITSNILIPENTQASLRFVAREPLVACGLFIAQMVYAHIDKDIIVDMEIEEGMLAPSDQLLFEAKGKAKSLLTGERVVLNLIQRMSAVATLSRKYVDAVAGTKATILDTRKTMPCLRIIDKHAVRVGGGKNHRMRLDDMVLIKDNHIVLCEGIKAAVTKARKATQIPIVVECDTLEQLKDAIAAKPDRVLLDNMNIEQLKEAVKIANGTLPLEASGNVSLDNVRYIANTGVDYISIGKLTHSAIAVDIGADLIISN